MLLKYTPKALPKGQQPVKSTLVVAQNGLGIIGSPVAAWVDTNRTVSSVMGWESLLGNVERLDFGTDHFGVFRYPQVSRLDAFYTSYHFTLF